MIYAGVIGSLTPATKYCASASRPPLRHTRPPETCHCHQDATYACRRLESVRWFYGSRDVLDPGSDACRTYVAGESSDTLHLRISENGAAANFLLGADDMVVVYGANDPIWNEVVGMRNHEFGGSAEDYLAGDPMAPYLYAIRVVRNPSVAASASDEHSVVVPGLSPDKQSVYGPPFYPDVIGLDKPAFIGYRAYLNPAIGAGPAYEDIIPDRAIWFKLRK